MNFIGEIWDRLDLFEHLVISLQPEVPNTMEKVNFPSERTIGVKRVRVAKFIEPILKI